MRVRDLAVSGDQGHRVRRVVAPSSILKRAVDRVKTARRDTLMLARLSLADP